MRVPHLRTLTRRSSRRPDGPVADGLQTSLRRALSAGLGVWQLVVLAAITVTDTRVPTAILVLVHVLAVGACLLTATGRLPVLPVLLALYAVCCVDYLACSEADGALLLAAAWLGNLLHAASVILLDGTPSVVVPTGAAVAIAAVLAAGSPDWTVELSSSFVVSALAMVVATRMAMPTLWVLATDADDGARAAVEQEQARRAARRASRETAEDARIVHDTVVNTLAAVANGLRGADQLETLRRRCRADAQRITTVLRGRPGQALPSLAAVSEGVVGIRVVEAGIAGSELRRQESLLAPATLRALHAATTELVRNAGKHAGTDRVVVAIERHGDLVQVIVSDDGRGFDPHGVVERGLTHSVRRRLAELGGHVQVDSEPGRGTTVRLGVPVATAEDLPVSAGTAWADVASTVDAIGERAAWVWLGAVLVVGVVIEAVNRPGELTWTYLTLAITGVGAFVVRRVTRRGRRLPAWVVGVLLVTLVPAFLAGLAGVDFGRSEVNYYQAVAITPVLVLLLTFVGARTLWAGLAVLMTSGAVVAAMLATDYPAAAVTVLIGTLPAVGLCLGWVGFRRILADLVSRSARERDAAARSAAEVAARLEVASARRRWRDAGLRSSLELMEGLAESQLDPTDREVRARCAAEEAYLRQLIQLSPDAYRMSAWFARALAESRRRDVRLMVRSGETDASDERDAAALGELIVVAVAAAAPGEQVVAGLFPNQQTCRLVIVGASGGLALAAQRVDPRRWQWNYSSLPDQDVLEVVPLGGPQGVRDDGDDHHDGRTTNHAARRGAW